MRKIIIGCVLTILGIYAIVPAEEYCVLVLFDIGRIVRVYVEQFLKFLNNVTQNMLDVTHRHEQPQLAIWLVFYSHAAEVVV